MSAFCPGTSVQYPKTSAVLLLVSLLAGACGRTHSPAQTSDPAHVARQVIADFLSLPVSEVLLVSIEARDFNDSSLGCPGPGMAYQQVITPGYRAIVEAQGRRFDIRVAGGHGRICHDAGRRQPETGAARESSVMGMIDLARRSLADALDADAQQIRVRDVRPWDGKTPPAGCTPQCVGDKASCGYIIGLFYDGRRYEYYAIDGKTTPCPPILQM